MFQRCHYACSRKYFGRYSWGSWAFCDVGRGGGRAEENMETVGFFAIRREREEKRGPTCWRLAHRKQRTCWACCIWEVVPTTAVRAACRLPISLHAQSFSSAASAGCGFLWCLWKGWGLHVGWSCGRQSITWGLGFRSLETGPQESPYGRELWAFISWRTEAGRGRGDALT